MMRELSFWIYWQRFVTFTSLHQASRDNVVVGLEEGAGDDLGGIPSLHGDGQAAVERVFLVCVTWMAACVGLEEVRRFGNYVKKISVDFRIGGDGFAKQNSRRFSITVVDNGEEGEGG